VDNVSTSPVADLENIDDGDNWLCLSTAAYPGILVIWDGGVQ
jgi:hypothetical protein